MNTEGTIRGIKMDLDLSLLSDMSKQLFHCLESLSDKKWKSSGEDIEALVRHKVKLYEADISRIIGVKIEKPVDGKMTMAELVAYNISIQAVRRSALEIAYHYPKGVTEFDDMRITSNYSLYIVSEYSVDDQFKYWNFQISPAYALHKYGKATRKFLTEQMKSKEEFGRIFAESASAQN